MLVTWRELNYSRLRKPLLIGVFLLFIMPYSIGIGGQGVSANYLFALFPVLIILLTGVIYRPGRVVEYFLLLSLIVFILASIAQLEYSDFFLRRIASFVVYLSVFTYMFVNVDEDMIYAFKVSIIVFSVYLCLKSLIVYVGAGGEELRDYAKGMVGSQRIGFLYLMSFWILILDKNKKHMFLYVKYMLVAIILMGMLLTFSRSTIVGLIGSLIVYMFFLIKRNDSFTITPRAVVYGVIMGVVLVVIINYFVSDTFRYFDVRLFKYFKSGPNDIFELITNPGSSIGYRFMITNLVFEFILNNPLTGSGFLGVWVLFDNLEGSAHSQYLDALFRLGPMLFLLYIYILLKLARFLYKNDLSLFYGFIAILFIGFFHETFKLSHGSFVLALMLGYMSTRIRKGKQK